MHPLHALMPLLRLDRHGRDWPRLESAYTDRLASFLAVTISAAFDTAQSLVDLGNEFAGPVTGAQFKRPVGFNTGAIGDVRFQNAALGQAGQCPIGFLEQFGTPTQQLLSEIFALRRTPEFLVLRRSVVRR